MWPTPLTLWLLLAGLLPPAYCLWLVLRFGFGEAVSLRSVGVLALWAGYHLSPWLGFFQQDVWDPFLLVPEHIDDGLLFSVLCMGTFLAGFGRVHPPGASSVCARTQLPRGAAMISLRLLLALSLVTLGLFLLVVGGPEEAWKSSVPRGWGQFDDRDFLGKLRHMATIACTVANVILACVASVYLLQPAGPTAWQRILVGIPALLIASLEPLHWFSRVAGQAFMIFAFFALRIKGHRGIPVALLAVASGAYFGYTGLQWRGDYNPGLGNFLSAAAKPLDASKTQQAPTPDEPLAALNPLSGIEPWTRKAQERQSHPPNCLSAATDLLWNLQPLPSELVPLRPLGWDIAEMVNTCAANYGITTPALGEVYYAFGHLGSLLMFGLGMLYGYVERLAVRKPGLATYLCLLLFAISLPASLQKNVRTQTRLFLYGLALCWAFNRGSRVKGNLDCSQLSARRDGVSQYWRSKAQTQSSIAE